MQQQDLVDRAEKAEAEKLIVEKKFFEVSQECSTVKEELNKEKEIRVKVNEKIEKNRFNICFSFIIRFTFTKYSYTG